MRHLLSRQAVITGGIRQRFFILRIPLKMTGVSD